MKIKLFEDYTVDKFYYEIGDYVLLADDNSWSSNVAKILDKKINTLEFFIRTQHLESGRKWEGWVNFSEIKKKISFEEYKEIKKRNFLEYKIKKDVNKFNL